MGDQPDAETSSHQHTTHTRDRHPYHQGIRIHNSGKPAAADLRLRLRSRWDRPFALTTYVKFCMTHIINKLHTLIKMFLQRKISRDHDT